MSDLSSRNVLVPGLTAVVLGLLSSLSMLLAMSGLILAGGALWPLAAPGDLLFRSFHVAGFYLPLYLFVIGGMILGRRGDILPVVLLSLGVVPAMLAGLALRLMFTNDFLDSPLPAWMVQNLTHQGAVIVAAASTLISLVALLQLPGYVREVKHGLAKRTPSTGAGVAKPAMAKAESAAKAGAVSGGETQANVVEMPDRSEDRGFSDTKSDSAQVPGTASGIAESQAVIDQFRSAMNGKLESRLKARTTRPVDLDAPLAADEAKRIWSEEEELAERQAALEAGAYSPRRPMFFHSSETAANEEDAELAVYFSKDGEISDYPPRGKRSWNTLADDDLDGYKSPEDSAVLPMSPLPPLPAERPLTRQATPVAHEEAVPVPRTVTENLVAAPRDEEEYPVEEFGEAEYAAPETLAELPSAGNHPDPATEPETDNQAFLQPADPALVSRVRTPAVMPQPVADGESHPVEPPVGSAAGVPDWRTQEAEPFDPAEVPETIDTSILPPMETMSSRFELAKGPGGYMVPIKGLLEEPRNHQYWVIDDATTRAASILKQTLEEFGIAADVTGIRKGPVITMFEILPAPGVKLAKIVNLADNIALRLAAQTVRIVAPIPGKHAVGIEIPNRERAIVSFSELLMAEGFSSPKIELPVALGIDIAGEAQIVDLARTPHLLIAGSTGSGKSVCVNALICSLLYRCSPAEVNMILIDPKIVELKFYNDIPHLLTPVITDAKKAFQALQWCLFEMERRYSLLDAMQVRDIKSYNKKIKARHIATPHLPYLVVVIDEFADLMATSGKELEGTLARLAAMSRAVGIHLVLATQRPSADVITGLIKANIPSRIAFMVASKIDSRIIIDGMGAEKLLGKGDMLFTSAWDPFPFRMQGAFLSEEEVERIVTHVKTLGKPDYIDDEIFFDAEEETDSDSDEIIEGADDPLLKEAIDIVVAAKKASASYIQRRLKIGYNRAARMVEQMEEMGIVGPAQGSKPREILRMFQ